MGCIFIFCVLGIFVTIKLRLLFVILSECMHMDETPLKICHALYSVIIIMILDSQYDIVVIIMML